MAPSLGNSTPLAKADLFVKLRRGKLLELDYLERQKRLHDVEACRQRRLRQIQEVKAALLDLPRQMEPEIGAASAERLLGRCMEILKRFTNGLLAEDGPRSTLAEGAAVEEGKMAEGVSSADLKGLDP